MWHWSGGREILKKTLCVTVLCTIIMCTKVRAVSMGWSTLSGFDLSWFCGFGFSSWNFSNMAATHGSRWLFGSQQSLSVKSVSAYRNIPSIQLWNSFLKVVFPSASLTSSIYSMNRQICAKLYAKRRTNVWCKNIRTFLSYCNLRVGTFCYASPCNFTAEINTREFLYLL